MSKAFTNEDTPTPDDADALPPRARRLPITAAGYARLRRELDTLTQRTRAGEVGTRRARVLAQVLDGRRIVYDLVGPDEADLAAGQIGIASPVGQALLGKRAGDQAVLRRPKGNVEVTVRSVALP